MANVNKDSPYIQQASSLLNGLVKEMGGSAQMAARNVGTFISVAQTTLRGGYDPVINALSQLWGKTIFASRAYESPLKGLEMDAERWGNATMKISFADADVEDDERFTYPAGYDATQSSNPTGDGLSVDMYKLHKPKAVRTVFYGQSVFEDTISILKDQFDVAFRSPEEFVQFNAGVMQARKNKLEQYREAIRRGLLMNAITALYDEDDSTTGGSGRVIHLLTEYNTLTGQELTVPDIYQADNFKGFIGWLKARITTLTRFMAERNIMYTTQLTGYTIPRFTPPENLHMMFIGEMLDRINAMALPFVFNDEKLSFADIAGVAYWQNPAAPMTVKAKPSYTKPSGDVYTAGSAVEVENVVGLLFDGDALGYAAVNEWSGVTPLNTVGGYWNDTLHVNFRTRFDMTEKMVLLLLD